MKKYLYESYSESRLSYIDKITFMNYVKDFAKKDLGIESDTTPYILETDMRAYGSTVSYRMANGSDMLGYVKINESQELYEMINTILHETKHVQQSINKPLYYRLSNKIQQFLTKRQMYDGLFYFFSLHEISARRYAKKAMKKYHLYLNNLIELAYDGYLGELLH